MLLLICKGVFLTHVVALSPHYFLTLATFRLQSIPLYPAKLQGWSNGSSNMPQEYV